MKVLSQVIFNLVNNNQKFSHITFEHHYSNQVKSHQIKINNKKYSVLKDQSDLQEKLEH